MIVFVFMYMNHVHDKVWFEIELKLFEGNAYDASQWLVAE